ncbi:YcaO-like family protein [Pendulispora rubella]|uniref:YcaO-like family protein n=1 Tax=Pendulispora rubella TaxID=2741070 RepID=A0ABZ2KP88_9BACT
MTPKGYSAGTHRTVAPAETLARVRRLMPVFGITRIANVTGLDRVGIPVVMVCRPNARSLAVSQGKGLDLDAAKASGLMESVEVWHAERVQLPLRLASLNELRYEHTVADVARLPRAAGGAFHDHARLLWVEGTDLLSSAGTFVPFELVHTNYVRPLPTGSGAFLMSTNGLASGNHPLEALSHAICELVERDATTLWNLMSTDAQRDTMIDVATIDDPACVHVLTRIARAELDVAIWETTSDVGLPSFLCAVLDRSPDARSAMPLSSGAGCHPSRGIALLRALTEAVQTRLTFISGSRDDVARGTYEASRDLRVLERFRSRFRDRAGKHFGDGPGREHARFEDDVAWELAALRGAGIAQVIAVDLTRPEFGIPVVRVVAPGLESIGDAPGYRPGARARQRISEGRA